MSFLTTRRTLGFKIEGTPYVKETLSAADFDLSAYNISYTPEVPVVERKIVRGDFGKEVSIPGKRTVTVSFSVDCQEGVAAATEPSYYKCLRACGLKMTKYESRGIGLKANSDYSNVPATIEIVEKNEGTTPTQLVIAASGCMGNPKYVVDSIGTPLRYDFEFKGILDSIADRAFGSILDPTGFMINEPDSVMGISVTAFDEILTLNKVTIDLGNDVQLFTDPSRVQGVSGAHVVGRSPKIDIDPDLLDIASQDFFAKFIDKDVGSFNLTLGDRTTISASVQISKTYAPGDREGHVVNNITLNVTRDNIEILQGTK
jgi:hypothetical protein